MSAASSCSSLFDWSAALAGEMDVSDLIAPDPCTYISFSFDVRQTLDYHRCDIDEETEKAIEQFILRQYVACFVRHDTLPFPGKAHHRARLRLLQQGLPNALPQICFDPSMSYPIAPETLHPLHRTPVKTNHPLPWNGCYHPTLMDITARLVQCRHDYTNAFEVDLGDHLLTNDYFREDDQRMETSLALKEGRTVEPVWIPFANGSQSSLHSSDIAGPDFCDFARSDMASAHSDIGSSREDENESNIDSNSDDGSELDDAEDYDAEPILYNDLLQCARGIYDVDNDLQFTPVVKYSPDLSGIPFLHDIHQFHKDLEALEELVRKCREGPPMPAPTLNPAVDPLESHPELATVHDLRPDDNHPNNSSRASGSRFLTCLRKSQKAVKTRVVKFFNTIIGKRRMNV